MVDDMVHDLKFNLSFLIPMRFTSRYKVVQNEVELSDEITTEELETILAKADDLPWQEANWWQWRGRVWGHKVQNVA